MNNVAASKCRCWGKKCNFLWENCFKIKFSCFVSSWSYLFIVATEYPQIKIKIKKISQYNTFFFSKSLANFQLSSINVFNYIYLIYLVFSTQVFHMVNTTFQLHLLNLCGI